MRGFPEFQVLVLSACILSQSAAADIRDWFNHGNPQVVKSIVVPYGDGGTARVELNSQGFLKVIPKLAEGRNKYFYLANREAKKDVNLGGPWLDQARPKSDGAQLAMLTPKDIFVLNGHLFAVVVDYGQRENENAERYLQEIRFSEGRGLFGPEYMGPLFVGGGLGAAIYSILTTQSTLAAAGLGACTLVFSGALINEVRGLMGTVCQADSDSWLLGIDKNNLLNVQAVTYRDPAQTEIADVLVNYKNPNGETVDDRLSDLISKVGCDKLLLRSEREEKKTGTN